MTKPSDLVWYKNPLRWLTETNHGTFVLWIMVTPLLVALPWLTYDGKTAMWLLVVQASTPVLFMALMLWSQFGSPVNWWVPFFGTRIKVNKTKIIQREQKGESSDAIHAEIAQWVKGMTRSSYMRNPYEYQFLRKKDAAMFKLAWG